jgi:hypothetical protein
VAEAGLPSGVNRLEVDQWPWFAAWPAQLATKACPQPFLDNPAIDLG